MRGKPEQLVKTGITARYHPEIFPGMLLELSTPQSNLRATSRNHEALYLCSPRSTPRISLGQIPKGSAGTRKTVAHIIGLIKDGAKDFCIRQHAIDILFAHGVPPKDYLGEIRTLCAWIQQHVRYTRDIHRVELLHADL
jgi:hypothetical protein